MALSINNFLIELEPALQSVEAKNLPEIAQCGLLRNLYIKNRMDLLLELVSAGININARDSQYETVLDSATKAGDLEAVRSLVEAGANPFQINDRGLNKLDKTLMGGKIVPKALFKYYLDLGVNPYNCKSIPLFANCHTEQGELVDKFVLQEWSSFTENDIDYKKAILKGDLNGALSILKRLLNNLGPVHPQNGMSKFLQALLADYRAVLHLLGQMEEANVIGQFLNENHDFESNQTLPIRENLYHFALFSGNRDLVRKYHDSIQRFRDNEIFYIYSAVLGYLFGFIQDDKEVQKEAFAHMQECYRGLFDYRSEKMLNLFMKDRVEDIKAIEDLICDGMLKDQLKLKAINIYLVYLISKRDYSTAKSLFVYIMPLNVKALDLSDYILYSLIMNYIEEKELNENGTRTSE